MPVILTTLNARYTHSNLAIRYLAESAAISPGVECKILEFHINQPHMAVFDELMDSLTGDGALVPLNLIGFSTYIWNRGETLRIARMIKSAFPLAIIALGGPEASYDPSGIFAEAPEVDLVFVGEGETPFSQALTLLIEAGGNAPNLWEALGNIRGIAVNPSRGGTGKAEPWFERDLSAIPNPYTRGYQGMQDRIAYYETTRGCPFRCSYCLSSLYGGVRSLPMGRILRELEDLSGSGVLQVKFVDRTFNADAARAREIWKHLLRLSPGKPPYPTTYHFEIGADLLTADDLDLLSTVPLGLFQFEVGVQSVEPRVLREICRRMDLDKLRGNVEKLVGDGRIAVNLDLIAGLPGESVDSLLKGLDYCLDIRPSGIHLGLLKLLHGSDLRTRAGELGLAFSPLPPYEVLGTREMTPGDLAGLRRIEEVLELFYNSGRFEASMDMSLEAWEMPSNLFLTLSKAWTDKGYAGKNNRPEKAYGFLEDVLESKVPGIRDAVDYDRLTAGIQSGRCRKPDPGEAERLRTRFPDSRETGRRWVIGEFETDPRPSGRGSGSRKPVRLAFAYGPPSRGRSSEMVVEL